MLCVMGLRTFSLECANGMLLQTEQATVVVMKNIGNLLERRQTYPAPSAADQAVVDAALRIPRGGAYVAVAVAVPVCVFALAAIVVFLVIMQQRPAWVHLQVCKPTNSGQGGC